CFGHATASITEPQICYIMDSILFLYGLILTVLYCRLKWVQGKEAYPVKKNEGIYEGLAPHAQDTYETIQLKKGLK
ncbi:hypothetical protein DKP78_22015, partial [Enterococcus faecium]